MSKYLSLSLLLASLVTFASCGSNGDSKTGTSGGGGNVVAQPGPIDGTWKQTGVLCNGIAGTGTATDGFTPPRAQSFVLTNTTGVSVSTAGTCTITAPLTLSYAAGNLATASSTGNWGCNPAGCGGAMCGTAVPAFTNTFKYTLTATTLALLITAGIDQTCTTATPVQADPVTHTFTKQ